MKKVYAIIVLIIMIMACGCGAQEETDNNVTYFHSSMNDNSNAQNSDEQDSVQEAIPEESKEIYLVVSINTTEESMRVYRYANGLEYQYYYGLTTRFLNKYGDYMSVANLEVGDVINILGADSMGKATTVQLSNEVWTYDDITKFSIDETSGVMLIADTKYQIMEDTFAFSGDEKTGFADIGDKDKLSVVGIDKKILSVRVTSGHGMLKLENTELFEGSYLQLNTKIFVEITPNMLMEVPEGEYTLAVANDGWGGTTDIAIVRGETTTVNLDEIKGEGPKYSSIQFVVDVEGAQVYLDNELVDYSQINQVRYGNHALTVIADGYDTWSRTLCVNSSEATIIISLTGDESEEENESEESESEEGGSSSGNNSGNEDSDNKDSSTSSGISDKELTDYLSTLSSLISLGN